MGRNRRLLSAVIAHDAHSRVDATAVSPPHMDRHGPERRGPVSRTAGMLALLFTCLGCEGVLVDGNFADGSTPGGDDGEHVCEPRIERSLLLLGELAFVNSLRDLLGADSVAGRLAPDAYTKPFTQKGYVANTSLVSSRLEWATHATRLLSEGAEEVTGCTDATDVCARSYLAKVAQRGFRRPVDAEELDDLMVVFAKGKEQSFSQGIALAVQAILVSPSFNHRTEYGVETEDGHYELSPHEVASAISYLLTDSLPDEELLEAADSGALGDPDEREAQVTRLLARADVQDSVEKTLMAAWTLGNLFGKVKDPAVFPEFNATLASQMYRETELFLKEHLWREGSGLGSVLTSRTTYVNEALAKLYGVPFPGTDPTEFVAVELPRERAGLLTHASVMTTLARTDNTSVVARGLFVNGPLLCLPKIPSPPEDAIAEIEAQLEHDMTERERAQVRAETSPCRNCHDQFDAFGLLFENYDAIGKYRTELDGEPIDASVDFSKNASFDGTYEDAVTFTNSLSERQEFVACVSRHLLAYGTGSEGLSTTDCEIKAAASSLSTSSTLADVVRAVVRSPALTVRTSGAQK